MFAAQNARRIFPGCRSSSAARQTYSGSPLARDRERPPRRGWPSRSPVSGDTGGRGCPAAHLVTRLRNFVSSAPSVTHCCSIRAGTARPQTSWRSRSATTARSRAWAVRRASSRSQGSGKVVMW